MPGRSVALPLLCVLLLAGCVDAPAARSPDPRQDVGDASRAEAPVEAPQWRLGDHWTYRAAHGAVLTFVVAEDGGGDWIVHPTDADTAFHHARDEISYLGAVGKADLAGSQGTDRVKYFQWPLEDGASWTTRWDGLDVKITAARLEQDRFRFNAYAGDTLHAAYTYDPRERWFTRIAFYDEAGDEVWGMRLDGAGHNYSGAVHRADAQQAVHWQDGYGEAEEHTFDVPAGITDVWLRYRAHCDGQQGVWALALGPDPVTSLPDLPDPDAQWTAHGTCPGDASEERTFHPHPGPWRLLRAATPASGAFDAEVWLRTLETIQVG